MNPDPILVTVRFRRMFPWLGEVPRFTARDLRRARAGKISEPLCGMILAAMEDSE